MPSLKNLRKQFVWNCIVRKHSESGDRARFAVEVYWGHCTAVLYLSRITAYQVECDLGKDDLMPKVLAITLAERPPNFTSQHSTYQSKVRHDYRVDGRWSPLVESIVTFSLLSIKSLLLFGRGVTWWSLVNSQFNFDGLMGREFDWWSFVPGLHTSSCKMHMQYFCIPTAL